MRFLSLDVSDNRRNKGCAHAECGIALLPCEFMALLVGPLRGIRFDGENRLGKRQRWRDLDEEMNVIVHAADRTNENPVVFANAGDIGPHSWLEILRDEFGAVFGAEDDVEYVLGVCVRHVSRLRRLAILYITDPALPGWANLCRAYGAGDLPVPGDKHQGLNEGGVSFTIAAQF